ncbi:peptidylprolyl isomerase [Noviherbaspirillum sp. CPCC 100848]|uniref:Chaperone SurA n=1 Tax=Noviherbaspirillum album TaxID=3080276 RepID=A0ABU6J9C6_9BURK|nr:peptidylprolyl isomerase [Noviherbaspirillum sp. CPCC 100848]MEC4720206.1 peptidylprolyl isomerase [Noviherbaspirillum sp. CPCC 100848]
MKTLSTLRVATNPVRSIALAAAMLCGAGLLQQAHAQFKAAPSAVAPAAPSGAMPAPAAQSAPRIYLADAIIAVVNNEVITRQELVERLRQVEQRMRNQNIALPPQAEFQRQMLERMIVDRAQLQLAKELGIRVDDAMLDRAVARIAEQNKMTLTQFRSELERGGTPFARFREEIREDIIMQRLREREVDNKIQISESEVDNYLAAEQSAAANQKEYNVAHILVRIPENATPEQTAERRRRAEEVLRQVQGGGDFAKLAATYSDATDALTGGDLGWRGPERLPQLFVDAIASMKQGDVSQLLKSNTGFHIVKLAGERTPSVMKGGAAVASVQQTRVRHILIKTNQIVTPSEARRKLNELKQRLDNKAATFEELAKLFSNDLSASRGGDLGWIYPGDTVPEFERAMDALQPGQVSEPVESPFGYHLIQVVERKTDDVSKERQRLIARQAIRERKLEEATQDWLRQLRDRAYVEYRFDNADSRS